MWVRLGVLLALALTVTAALQASIFAASGGIAGYIARFSELRPGSDPFEGMGWQFMISESFPIVAFIGMAIYLGRRARPPSWQFLIGALVLFFAAKLLFGGLRGSRSNTIWGLFWAVGIIHFWLRRIPRVVFVGGLAALLGFMYLYGFYKDAGADALAALSDAEARAQVSSRSGRTLQTVVLGDLARSDVQAFLLYRLSSGDDGFQLAWGRTYLGTAALVIPRALWPQRPPAKAREGTDLQYGHGTYDRGFSSSRVYGLAGEAMLNFGPVGAVLSFAILALAGALVSRFSARSGGGDPRILLSPFLVNACFWLLVGDSDNVLFFVIKNGAVPFLLIVLATRRVPTPSHRATIPALGAGGVAGGAALRPTHPR